MYKTPNLNRMILQMMTTSPNQYPDSDKALISIYLSSYYEIKGNKVVDTNDKSSLPIERTPESLILNSYDKDNVADENVGQLIEDKLNESMVVFYGGDWNIAQFPYVWFRPHSVAFQIMYGSPNLDEEWIDGMVRLANLLERITPAKYRICLHADMIMQDYDTMVGKKVWMDDMVKGYANVRTHFVNWLKAYYKEQSKINRKKWKEQEKANNSVNK